jgi:hypothetical protein
VNALLATMPAALRPQYIGQAKVRPDLDHLCRIHFVKAAGQHIVPMDPSEAIAEIFDALAWKSLATSKSSFEMLLQMEDKVVEAGPLNEDFFASSAKRSSG